MRRGYKVDVVALLLVLEVQHDFRQSFDRDLTPFRGFGVLAYLKILAVDAGHVAVAEENRAGTAVAGYCRFLSEVSAVRRDNRQSAGTAEARLIFDSVHPALSGTDIAFFEPLFKGCHPFMQFAGFV